MSTLQRISMTIEEDLAEQFDEVIRHKGYESRSEAIRDLIRRSLVERQWEEGTEEVVGTLTVVYDHEKREIAKKIVRAGHEEPGLVLATLHIHLDHHNCLEVMALRGMPAQVRRFADGILHAKGVKHGDLVMTTMGCHV